MKPALTPAYRLTIGPTMVDTTREARASTVVDLSVQLDLDVPADVCTIVLGNVDGLHPVSGDAAKVELGYHDDDTLAVVLTGAVVDVSPGVATTRVVIHGNGARFLRSFVDRTFERKTAGAIVRELAGLAAVGVAHADEGIEFPAYVVDRRRSAYHHMRDLADLSGLDLYVDENGKLALRRFVGGQIIHVFEHAKHVVAFDALAAPLRADSVEAWGESPGTSHGEASWGWLVRDFRGSVGTAGSGSTKLVLERPALRTAAAAQTAARAALTTLRRRAVRGRVSGLGRPQVRLGDGLRIKGIPREDLNGLYQVRAVTHRVGRDRGFTTAVEFRGAN